MSRRYTQEFKDSILRMVKYGANAKDLAEEYGPHYQTIMKWVRESKSEIDFKENDVNKLKKQLRALKRENDILKSAAIIFAKR